MQLPTSVYGVTALILLVIPGVSFSTARTLLIGHRNIDTTIGVRILEAVFASVVFDCLYAIVFGNLFTFDDLRDPDFVLKNVGLLGLLVLALLITVPCVVALLIFGTTTKVQITRGPLKGRTIPVLTRSYESTPTAWDKEAQRIESGRFVRVRLEDGAWVGGWFSTRSFLSTYPQPRDIFIESQYEMTDDGVFGQKIDGTAGVWLAVTEKCVIEWVASAPSSEDERTLHE
ncbi:DUF6338 family protein [Arthrobacter sp. 1P04PC]|uniref:DUF6338 family protein n=1 Tax=unclassified Arthrobacter TaxID=235627 RepID=UPI0039A2B47E